MWHNALLKICCNSEHLPKWILYQHMENYTLFKLQKENHMHHKRIKNYWPTWKENAINSSKAFLPLWNLILFENALIVSWPSCFLKNITEISVRKCHLVWILNLSFSMQEAEEIVQWGKHICPLRVRRNEPIAEPGVNPKNRVSCCSIAKLSLEI